MINASLRKTIAFSLFGHLTIFGIFGFSFGRRIPPAGYENISFYGAILQGYDLTSRPALRIKDTKEAFLQKAGRGGAENRRGDYQPISAYHYKPPLAPFFSDKKTAFTPRQELAAFIPQRKESVVMFYPPLPYHFMFYFQDRQSARIEIMFKLSLSAGVVSLEAKRKISSGNLEVDLLSMRYLSPYLFSQQKNFASDSWHTLKVDLSPRGR